MGSAVGRNRSRDRPRRRSAHLAVGGDGAWGKGKQAGGTKRAQSLVVHDGATIAMLSLDVPAAHGRPQRTVK